jgi:hypothetical protein
MRVDMLDKHTGLTAEILRKWVYYDPDTGFFYWRESATGRGSGKRIAGQRAGWKDKLRGYRNIQLPGHKRSFLEHRLAWLYMTGEWPEDQVDHRKPGVFDDNRWDNLREATNSRNQANRGLRPHNKTGVTGVWKQGNRWFAECQIDGVRVLSKSFVTKEEAIEARRAAVEKYHGEFGVKP